MTALPLAALLLAAASLLMPDRARLRLPRLPAAGAEPRLPVAIPAAAVLAAAASVTPALLVVATMAGTVVTVWRRRRRVERRRRAEGAAMASALEVLIGELRVGSHPARAFAVAGAESPGAVGHAMRRVAVGARLGADVTAGILAAQQDSAVPEHWRRLAVCWELAAQRGLAMSVLIGTAHQDIADRQRFADRVRAALAGARATAGILAVLPALGVALGELIGAHPLRFLLGGGAGGVLLVVGAGLITAGLAWADRIIEGLTA